MQTSNKSFVNQIYKMAEAEVLKYPYFLCSTCMMHVTYFQVMHTYNITSKSLTKEKFSDFP